MEHFKSQIDLFLTEISIELLGNKIYDINGIRQDKIINLFKAKPIGSSESNELCRMNENSNDFLCSLGYQSNFTERNKTVKAFLNNQLDHILKSANTSNKVNTDIIDFLRKYKTETSKLNEHYQAVKKKKIVGKNSFKSTDLMRVCLGGFVSFVC